MLSDIKTVLWKEIKEAFLIRGSLRSELLNIIVIIGVIGVLMPMQVGHIWLVNPLLPLMWSWLPMFKALGIITVSIAGERENHTLETLLASRLPDQAILIGKMATAVLYAWALNLICYLTAALTIHIAFPAESPAFYPLGMFGAILIFSLLINILIAAVGILVSLNSVNARQAYQKIGFVLMGIWILPTLALQFLPKEILQQASTLLGDINPLIFALLAGVVLIAIDLAVLAATQARFKRSRLILD